MVVNYNNGKIYKIINENSDTVYVGSTTQPLCQRYQRHNHKAPNHKIILIENHSCNSKEELCKREQEVIDEHSLLLNKCRAFGIDEFKKKKRNIKHNVTYREIHKEKLIERRKIKNKEKVKCEFCNKETHNSNLKRHQKSKKCIAFQNKDLV